jgi:hypothetical protein
MQKCDFNVCLSNRIRFLYYPHFLKIVSSRIKNKPLENNNAQKTYSKTGKVKKNSEKCPFKEQPELHPIIESP